MQKNSDSVKPSIPKNQPKRNKKKTSKESMLTGATTTYRGKYSQ